MKIVEKPDGSKEIEGTADELAEFERKRPPRFSFTQVTPQLVPYVAPVPTWPCPDPNIVICGGGRQQ